MVKADGAEVAANVFNGPAEQTALNGDGEGGEWLDIEQDGFRGGFR